MSANTSTASIKTTYCHYLQVYVAIKMAVHWQSFFTLDPYSLLWAWPSSPSSGPCVYQTHNRWQLCQRPVDILQRLIHLLLSFSLLGHTHSTPVTADCVHPGSKIKTHYLVAPLEHRWPLHLTTSPLCSFRPVPGLPHCLWTGFSLGLNQFKHQSRRKYTHKDLSQHKAAIKLLWLFEMAWLIIFSVRFLFGQLLGCAISQYSIDI